MDRLKSQAAKNREAAKVLRGRGRDTAAEELEDRADELESGRVTDCTDAVSGLISWAFRR
jgi:major membrane immunogen (membrane-anchored lipoprotein)